MAQERFVRLSELQKGDVVRSPQFVEPRFWGRRLVSRDNREKGEGKMSLVREREESRGNALFAVVFIEKRSYRPFLIFKREYFVVELRELDKDGSYNYDRESVLVHPGFNRNNPDFFVEVVGEMNFHWSGIAYSAMEG